MSSDSGVPIFTIQQGSDTRIISITDDRDGAHASSADTFVQIKFEGKEVTSSTVKGYEKYSVITTVISEVWRKETGDVSNTAYNSSAHLGVREVEFCMPYSDVCNTVLKAIAEGKRADIIFVRTGNIASHNVPILEITYPAVQFVNFLNVLQAGRIGSDTFRFKATSIQVNRINYDPIKGTKKGNNTFSIDFVTNTSK